MPKGIYKRTTNKGWFKKGEISWNAGLKDKDSHSHNKIFTEERKNNISLGIKKAYDKKGRKSSRNRLMRKSRQFMNWRREVFERDNWTCQRCGIRSKKGERIMLHPHHIKHLAKYPDLAFNTDNGITLCAECHQEIHFNVILTGKVAQKINKEPTEAPETPEKANSEEMPDY